MKSRSFIVFFLCIVFFAQSQEDENPPLPRWSDADAERLLQGENLISDALFRPISEEELAAPVMDGLSLPEYMAELLDVGDPTEIAEEDLVKYFDQKPKSFLTDPQKLLSRQEYRDRLSFLKYHASDSKVGFYVYVFDTKQIIPPNIRVEDVFQRCFADSGPTVLLFYFMGAPERSIIHLSPDLMTAVGRAESARARQSAVNQASVKSQAVDQLDGFCVQMSIRIYWMEKALEAGVIAPPEAEPQAKPEPAHKKYTEMMRHWWSEWNVPFCISVAVLLVGGVFSHWRRSRRKYRLPAFPVAVRLGGTQAAGVGAVISFAHANRPAAAQREQLPEDLGIL